MFAKFMNKKFFHPGSYPNIKRRWMAEQRALAKEKKEQEMRETYEKEQQTYQHKMLLAKKDEDKIKLGLNFMYDLPPGMKKEGEKEDDGNEEEVKFEWQKNAPRAKYAKKLGLDVHDQPFGICVRNVKCFRCGKWGHQNIDRECPMFSENKEESSNSSTALDSLYLSDPLRLIADMKRDHGLTLRKNVIGSEIDPMAENQQILDSDDDDGDNNDIEIDIAYIESLTDKQKKRLLKKLEKMEKRKAKEEKQKEKKSSKKISRKRKASQLDYEWVEPEYESKEEKTYRKDQRPLTVAEKRWEKDQRLLPTAEKRRKENHQKQHSLPSSKSKRSTHHRKETKTFC